MKRKMNVYLAVCLVYLAFFAGYFLNRWDTVLPIYKVDFGFLAGCVAFIGLPMAMAYLAGRADQ